MGLPDLFPRRDFVIETCWPPTVTAIEIRKRIAPPRGPSPCDEPFVGRALSKTEFRFSRANSEQNLLPVIEATVAPTHREGARVNVRMRLPDALRGLVALTMVIAALSPVTAVVSGGRAGLSMLAPCLLAIGVCGMQHAAFKREARRTEAILRGIFAAAPALPPPHDTGEPYR
jgi:hypothetical protein